ncbi:hypothetical protein ES705_20945 [subsurface metagenome]
MSTLFLFGKKKTCAKRKKGMKKRCGKKRCGKNMPLRSSLMRGASPCGGDGEEGEVKKVKTNLVG